MVADAPAPLPPPPAALFAVRARSRVADGAAFSGPPDTPPRRSPVTVPFLWEDAPGKPKAPPHTAATPAAANAVQGPVPKVVIVVAGGDGHKDSGHADQARPATVPLKLPPRLQQVPSFSSETPASPKTVLQGPYYGCAGGSGRRPPRWSRGGGGASFRLRRTPSGLLSRTWSKPTPGSGKSSHERDAAGAPDAPWCSPASSTSTSSSSVSTCFGGDDHGGRGRLAGDGREVSSEEDDGSPRGSVTITRFRRNRSLPSLTTSNLWASFRRSVKQIAPWS